MTATPTPTPVELHNDILRHLDREHGKQTLKTHVYRRWVLACKGAMYLMLGIAAMTYSSSASAEQIAFLENEAGGRIYLTDVESKDVECKSAYVAYATSPGGTLMFGCWLVDGEVVMVRWSDGMVRGYEIRQFRQVKAKPAARTNT